MLSIPSVAWRPVISARRMAFGKSRFMDRSQEGPRKELTDLPLLHFRTNEAGGQLLDGAAHFARFSEARACNSAEFQDNVKVAI